MLICNVCHESRQARQAPGSQPLQWTGYETSPQTTMNCPDCSRKRAGVFREYLNAFELVQELEEAKEKADKVQVGLTQCDFPVSMYEGAADMLQHCQATGRTLGTEEALQVLEYAAALEDAILS